LGRSGGCHWRTRSTTCTRSPRPAPAEPSGPPPSARAPARGLGADPSCGPERSRPRSNCHPDVGGISYVAPSEYEIPRRRTFSRSQVKAPRDDSGPRKSSMRSLPGKPDRGAVEVFDAVPFRTAGSTTARMIGETGARSTGTLGPGLRSGDGTGLGLRALVGNHAPIRRAAHPTGRERKVRDSPDVEADGQAACFR
jgi:hypothetical protein